MWELVVLLLGIPALLLMPVWLLVLIGKLLAVALSGRRRRPDWRRDLLRWGVGLALAAAVLVQCVGMLSVAISVNESSHGADATPAHECRALVEGRPEERGRLVGQEGSYLPLGFDCVRDDGSVYPSTPLYAWLNGAVLAFGVGSLLLAGAASRPGRPPTVPLTGPARATRAPATPGAATDPAGTDGPVSPG
ncbi:hypothetical protein ACN20G_27920 (plasmid) [Streptomyces sp. BI20]|uniref:hypothetical protein n=1 Tax=Streptomyces sp. BI20 TaxID=3403460 RepID=UPI003C70F1CF